MSVHVHIDEGPLGAPSDLPVTAGAGAVVCFEGVVRGLEDGQPIEALDYEAYRPMAERLLERLGQRLVETHGLFGIYIEHSVGRVPVGDISFRLRVTSAHRAEAIVAVDQFIHQMKQDVPIWKKSVLGATAVAMGESDGLDP